MIISTFAPIWPNSTNTFIKSQVLIHSLGKLSRSKSEYNYHKDDSIASLKSFDETCTSLSDIQTLSETIIAS